MSIHDKELSKLICYMLLKADTTEEDVKELCKEAMYHDFYAVCVPPTYVRSAGQYLRDSAVKVSTMVGYPMGYNTILIKSQACIQAMQSGVDEVDMMINLGAVKNKNWIETEQEIGLCTELLHAEELPIGIILQTSLLSNAEIVKICEICKDLKVDSVMASLGGGSVKADTKVVELLRANLPEGIGIKVSCKKDDKDLVKALLFAGASYLACSSESALET